MASRRTPSPLRRAPLVALFLVLPGCMDLGSLIYVLGDVLGPGMGGNRVQGDVLYVDTWDRSIDVVSGRQWRERVYYDRRTRVSYRGRTYSVHVLRRGDYVSMHVYRARYGDLYTNHIVLHDRRRRRGGWGW